MSGGDRALLIFAANRAQLRQRVGRISAAQLDLIFKGIDEVLGR